MRKSLFNTCLVTLLLSGAAHSAFAQQKTEATPVSDKMQAGILADPRVAELKVLDPAKLVSEATYAIEWARVYERDLYWKCRIYRTIDFRDNRNREMVAGVHGRTDLGGLFVKGVLQGRYKAYSNTDDRFTHEISADSVASLLKQSGISKVSGIEKFLVKQDWLYIGPEKKLVSRVIGIAPILETVAADGVTTEKPLFWIYYPSMRPYLREQGLPSIVGSARNLDELFEQWKFSSPILSVRQSDQAKTLNFLSPEQREQALKKD